MVLSGTILTLILIFVILMTMAIKVEIKLRLGFKHNDIKIQVKTLFNLIKVKKEFSLINLQKKAEDSPETHDDLHFLKEKITGIHTDMKPFIKIISHFFRKVIIKKLNWQTKIGMGNASTSAITSGVVWSFKGAVNAYINSHFRVKKSPFINVIPDFHQYIVMTELHCMITVSAGNTIKTGWKLYRTWKKLNLSYQFQHEVANRRTGDERTSN